MSIIEGIKVCVFVCLFSLHTKIMALVETRKPVTEVVCEGVGIRMGTGHTSMGGSEAPTVHHFIYSLHFESHECISYLEKSTPQWKDKHNSQENTDEEGKYIRLQPADKWINVERKGENHSPKLCHIV